MQLITHIEIQENFWEMNPAAKYVFHYIEHTEETSKLMWTYTLFYHPRSAYFEMSMADKIDSCRMYLKDEEWRPENNPKIDEDFVKHCLTRVQRSTITWGNKLDERTSFISKTPYNEENLDILEKLINNTKKVQDAYQIALAELRNEEEQATIEGISESASEMGLLD